MRSKLLFLASFLITLLAACGEDPAGEVSFMVFGDPEELAAYQELVATFEDANPDLRIALQHVPSQGDYRQRLAAGFSGGAPPDVMLINYRRFAALASQGGIEPLTSYLSRSTIIHEEDFYSLALESFHWNEELWCIPQNISSLVVYYNKDLFQEAGVPYPANNWSWTEFLEAARLLTSDTDGDGSTDIFGLGVDPTIFRLAPFIWQNGGRLVDDQENPSRLTIDEPAAMDAFQWFVDLQIEEKIAPSAADEVARNSQSRFLDGMLAMILNSRRGVPTYRTIDTFEWDVAPLPHGRRAAGILHSDGYCMAAAAENKDAAWRFIEFANSPAGQSIVARSGRTVPSMVSVAESAAFLDPDQSPANSRVFLETVPFLQRVPTMSTWVAIEETVSKEVERAFYGQVSVEEAVSASVDRTKRYFEEK